MYHNTVSPPCKAKAQTNGQKRLVSVCSPEHAVFLFFGKLPCGNCIAAERNCPAGIALGRGKTPCISAGGQDALDEKIRKSEVKKMDAGSNGAGSNGRSRNYWNKERMAAGFLRHFSLIL